jgi:uncharacterized membrane protein
MRPRNVPDHLPWLLAAQVVDGICCFTGCICLIIHETVDVLWPDVIQCQPIGGLPRRHLSVQAYGVLEILNGLRKSVH